MDLELNCFNSKQHHLSLGATGSGAGAGAALRRAVEVTPQRPRRAGRQAGSRGPGTAGGEAETQLLSQPGDPGLDFFLDKTGAGLKMAMTVTGNSDWQLDHQCTLCA